MDVTIYGLLVFLIAGAIVALEVRDLLSSVIAIGVVGLGLSILFLLLGAPDIAITQVVVEVIVVTVLIRATARISDEPASRRTDRFAVASGLIVAVVLFFLSAGALVHLPAFGQPAMTVSRWYLEQGPALTGATNVVMAILLDFRAYDTLGEATVILTAIVGALAIVRGAERPVDARATDAGMSLVVRAVTRWLLGLILIFGLAVALFGHLTPGGGFAGGVVLACGFVLATLAFGARSPPASIFGRLSSRVDAAGALAFLLIALLGWCGGHFFQRWLDLGRPFRLESATFIVLQNVAILFKVTGGAFAGFLALAVFRSGPAPEEGERS